MPDRAAELPRHSITELADSARGEASSAVVFSLLTSECVEFSTLSASRGGHLSFVEGHTDSRSRIPSIATPTSRESFDTGIRRALT